MLNTRLPDRRVLVIFPTDILWHHVENIQCLFLQRKRLPVRHELIFCLNVKHLVPIPPTERLPVRNVSIFFRMLNTRCLSLQRKRLHAPRVLVICLLFDCYSLTSLRKHPVPIPSTKKISCRTHIDIFCPNVKRPVPIPPTKKTACPTRIDILFECYSLAARRKYPVPIPPTEKTACPNAIRTCVLSEHVEDTRYRIGIGDVLRSTWRVLPSRAMSLVPAEP